MIQARFDEPLGSALLRTSISTPRFRSGGQTSGKVVGFKGIDDQAREVGIAPTAISEVVEAFREAVVLRGRANEDDDERRMVSEGSIVSISLRYSRRSTAGIAGGEETHIVKQRVLRPIIRDCSGIVAIDSREIGVEDQQANEDDMSPRIIWN